MTDPLLRIEGLRVEFKTDAGVVRAVDGVSYQVRSGETLAVVGESGCGKSVTAMAVLGLIESQRGTVSGGTIEFRGQSLREMSQAELSEIRGRDIAMIFQEPMTSLNPVYTVGDQIAEVLQRHLGLSQEEADKESVDLLELVSIPAPEERVHEYPHQLSGGMRQRVMIAMALACDPLLLIADEPTTALDVTVQAQILDLVAELQQRLGMAVLLITHDLGVVAQNAQQVVVMYAGQIVEGGSVTELFDAPLHPYTVGLMASLPRLDSRVALTPIEGNVPDALDFPRGCRFHPRCPVRLERCDNEMPTLKSASEGREVACFYRDDHPDVDLTTLLRSASQQKEGVVERG